MSHARNENEFQTPEHRWLLAKCWDTLFLNSSKSKTRLKFMKLGTLSWNGTRHAVVFFVHFERRRTRIMTANKGILKNSCHFNISNVCIIQTVCILLTIHVTPRVLVLMAVGGAVPTIAWPWLNGRCESTVWCVGWPRGVQAVLECAGSPGSVQVVQRRICASLQRKWFRLQYVN